MGAIPFEGLLFGEVRERPALGGKTQAELARASLAIALDSFVPESQRLLTPSQLQEHLSGNCIPEVISSNSIQSRLLSYFKKKGFVKAPTQALRSAKNSAAAARRHIARHALLGEHPKSKLLPNSLADEELYYLFTLASMPRFEDKTFFLRIGDILQKYFSSGRGNEVLAFISSVYSATNVCQPGSRSSSSSGEAGIRNQPGGALTVGSGVNFRSQGTGRDECARGFATKQQQKDPARSFQFTSTAELELRFPVTTCSHN